MDEQTIKIVGIIAGGFTAVSLLPQLVKLIRTKKAEDISLLYLITLFCGLVIWIWYGFLREDLPIILTNVTSVSLNIIIFILGFRYKQKPDS